MAAEKSNQQYAPWPGDLEALAAAAGIVHQRSPKCAPDLAFEGLS